MEKLEHITYHGRLEEASLLHAAWVIEYMEEGGIPVHPNLTRERDRLAIQLAVAPSFFDRRW